MIAHGDVVGICPGATVIIHLVGAVLAEQHDERAEGRRYLGADVLARSQAIDVDNFVDEEVSEPELPALTGQPINPRVANRRLARPVSGAPLRLMLPGMAAARSSPRGEHSGPLPPRASARIAPQELLVSLFATFGRATDLQVRSTTLADLVTHFGFSEGSARVAVNRMASRGLLERRREGRYLWCGASLRLREIMTLGDRRISELSLARHWDGSWTLVWNSLPDHLRRERHRLSRRLRFLGFGPLEDNLWVAPWDEREHMHAFAQANDIGAHVALFQSRQDFGSPEAIIARAWDVGDVRARYIEFTAEFGRHADLAPHGREAFEVYVRAFNTFRRLPYLDPVLPHDIFPTQPERDQACELFTKLESRLGEEARGYFAERTGARLRPL